MPPADARKLIEEAGFQFSEVFGTDAGATATYTRDGTRPIRITTQTWDGNVFSVSLAPRDRTPGGLEDWLDWLTGVDLE
jgi:hypothetical protein